PTQIVEGGVQVRITRSGMSTVTQALEAILNDSVLGGGICIPGVVRYDPGAIFPFIDACYRKDSCGGGQMGCRLDLSINSATLSARDSNPLRANVSLNAAASVPVHAYYSLFDVGSCTFNAHINNGQIVADVDIGIDPGTGNITLNLGGIDTVNIDNLDVS